MILTQADRNALGLVDYVDNKVIMTPDELKNIRDTLKLTQDGLGKVLNVSRRWVNRCETGKDGAKMTYAYAFVLRMLVDLPEGQRAKWINVAKRKNRTSEEVMDAIEDAKFTCDIKTIAYFKKNGYEV